MCAFAALMVAGFMLPQEVFAYMYYIRSETGVNYCFEAASKEEARKIFREKVKNGSFGEGGFTLTSRPNGGYMETSSYGVTRATEILDDPLG